MWNWLASLIGGPVVSGLINAYKTRLDAAGFPLRTLLRRGRLAFRMGRATRRLSHHRTVLMDLVILTQQVGVQKVWTTSRD
jgi:hypothetical protein